MSFEKATFLKSYNNSLLQGLTLGILIGMFIGNGQNSYKYLINIGP